MVAENRKLARLLQELRAQADEDHRVATELTDTVNTLTLKINTLKRQLLEAVRLRLISRPVYHVMLLYIETVSESVGHKNPTIHAQRWNVSVNRPFHRM